MKQLNRHKPAWLIAAVALLLGGCATTSIVKKPEVNDVKSIAILSLYADERVPEYKGRGVVKNWNRTFQLQVAEDALRTFQREFSRLGWKVYSANNFMQTASYQNTFGIPEMPEQETNSTVDSIVSFVAEQYQARYFTPANMWPIKLDGTAETGIRIGDAPEKPPQVAALAEIAKRLGIDAVAVVVIDYCYQGGTFSMIGNGEAIMTAASAIKVVNQAGDLVVNMPILPRCAGERGESTTTAAMWHGDLLLAKVNSDNARRMFIEATRNSAKISVSEVKIAM